MIVLQTLETPLHYTARSGNEDILMEIVHLLGPAKTLAAVNKQAKVLHSHYIPHHLHTE